MFHFTCFNVEDPDDPSVGLINGELAIPGNLLRREVFDPVVKQVRPRCTLPISRVTCTQNALSTLTPIESNTFAEYARIFMLGSATPHLFICVGCRSTRGADRSRTPTHRRFASCGRFLRQRIPFQASRCKCIHVHRPHCEHRINAKPLC